MDAWNNEPIKTEISHEVDVFPIAPSDTIKQEPCEYIIPDLMPTVQVEDFQEHKTVTEYKEEILQHTEGFLDNHHGSASTSFVLHQDSTSPSSLETVLPLTTSAVQELSPNNNLHKTTSIVFMKGDKFYRCSMCVKLYNESEFEHHQIIHRPNGEYGCPYCQQTFVQREVFRLHLCTHGLHCPICKQDFGTGYKLMKHECFEKWYNCLLCPEKFTSNSELEEHQQASHDNYGHFTCHLCFENIFGKSALEDHMEKVHNSPGGSKFPCLVCGLSFFSQQVLIRHLQMHNIHMQVLQTQPIINGVPGKKQSNAPCVIRALLMKKKEKNAKPY